VNVGFALVGDLASKAGGLAALAVAARFLPTPELARLGVVLALVTVLTAALDLGASTAIVRDGATDDAGAARVSRLLLGSTIARTPLLLLAVAAGLGVGAAVGEIGISLAAIAATATGVASLTAFALFRAVQDLRVEARARLAGAIVAPLAVGLAVWLHPTATAATAAFAAGPAVSLALAVRRAATTASWRTASPLLPALLAGLPFCGMALATLVYYRLGVFVLGASGDAKQTAALTLATSVGFGALALPNAITTGLLPRLCAEPSAEARRHLLGKALRWSVGLSAAVGGGLAAFALGGGVEAIFGERNAEAAVPLALLSLALVPIGAATVLGTALIAAGRTRVVALQVGVSIGVSLVGTLLLVPPFGARGAALATLATEAVAVAFLAVPLRTRPLAIPRIGDLQIVVFGAIGALVAMQVWAVESGYALRVISDTPSYLALLPRMAAEPLMPVTAFMTDGGSVDTHASPYTQLLATLWLHTGGEMWNPYDLARFLGWVGIPMTLLFLHAAFMWFRSVAGSRAAWIALPVLLVLFGPAHAIWAGDFTFHGFLYAAYYPQTAGMALLLYALVAIEGPPSRGRAALVTGIVAMTMLVHPFTALLLCVLLALRGAVQAARRAPGWQLGSWCLGGGFAIAHAWPSFSVSVALGEAGVPGAALVLLCALIPAGARALPAPTSALRRRASRRIVRLTSGRAQLGLAVAGAGILALLGVWTVLLFGQPNPDPLIRTNRLSLYWVEDRWRWPLMFAVGALGLVGLARLAVAARPIALLWFAGCFGVGALGAAGLPLPLWWRLILFAQLPLALGLGAMLTARGQRRGVTRLTIGALAASGVFKIATLLLAPTTITYFGTELQDAYRLGSMIPKAPGVVASDPFTSYFVPGATGKRVLVVTKAHVGSRAELERATRSYRLLHRFYMGRAWWQAAQTMYRQGVRYVVIEKSTSLAAPTLEEFSTGPTPLIRTARDRRLLGAYYYRNNRVGTLVYDIAPYTIYRLEPGKLFG
jgi:O-antigen/teichoic acid export membrane protein